MTRAMLRLSLLLFAATSASCIRGCTSSRPPIHINPNMDSQPKYSPQAESRFFYDGGAARPPVEGTVARGEFYENEALRTGLDENADFLAAFPMEVSEETLARGLNRFAIYCRPCHGETGEGDGVLFDYGVPVASFYNERVLGLPVGEVFNVITNGKGLMPSYRYPIPVHDRWAIVSYVRQMQDEWKAKQASTQ